MCGVAGWFSREPLDTPAALELEQMLAAIAHRGPDGQGCWVADHAALGHCRLAIIDPQLGAQPMHWQNRYHLVFNGEIYNYRELRQWLQQQGARFKTNSDSEVILALYECLGKSAFSRLRGMFALALWDSQTHTGLLVRDGFGIKPLFYREEATGLRFASEAKGIFAADQNRPQLDLPSLHALMNFRYLPGDGSLFAGIKQLVPGTIMEWRRDGTLRQETFCYDAGGLSETSPSLVELLQDSVNAHLVADVEVGSYLSGGLDSSIICRLASQTNTSPLTTFTLDVGDDPQELENARWTADHFGYHHRSAGAGEQVGQALLPMLWHLELPKVNALQVWQLSKLASEHVKVVLSGLGGDELFLGYNAHSIFSRVDQLSRITPSGFSHFGGRLMGGVMRHCHSIDWSEPERAALMAQSMGDWSRVYGLLRNVWDSPTLRQKIYGPRMLDTQLPDQFQWLSDQWPQRSDPVMAMAQFEWKNKMVNDLLWQEDRCSMANGLEVRVPFVDAALAQGAWQLNRQQLMPKGKRKGLLLNLAESWLPQEILRRPKSGFQVDSPHFFHHHLVALAKTWLSEERLRASGLFNPKFVTSVLKAKPGKALRWHYFILYLMLMTELWLAIFEQGLFVGQLQEKKS